MDLIQNLSDRDRLARTLLAIGLPAGALASLRKRKRLPGVLAGLGPFAIGYAAPTDSGDGMEHPTGTPNTEPPSMADRTTASEQLRWGSYGEENVPGQSRRRER